MATETITLEPRNVAAAVKSLQTEFAKAKMAGVKTITKKGALYVEMPIARLSDYQFSSTPEHCSWKTPKKKIVIRTKGFVVEQQIHNKAFHVVFRAAKPESKVSSAAKTSAIRHIFLQRSLRAIEE